MTKKAFLLFFFAFLVTSATAYANPFEYQYQELAPGVWAAVRQDPFELPQEGNAAFVITNEGVVLFDAGGSPAMGESIVAKVRSLTNKPITHVVLSHWHGDHMRGLQSIRAAFPNAVILAHPFARDFIVSTQDKWLKRRVSMVPNIRKGLAAALSSGHDLAGRDLIAEERAWLTRGETIVDQLDHENNRTTYVIPNATFTDRLTLYLGGREIDFLRLGNSHTAGDIVMWLPQERVVATGDIVTAPIPLMPSAYTNEYANVLNKIKSLGFTTLLPGHGAVEHDAAYLDLLSTLVENVNGQMKALVSAGVSKDDAIAKIDFSTVQERFTHGDPFLTNRFHDYVTKALPAAAYAVETGSRIQESF